MAYGVNLTAKRDLSVNEQGASHSLASRLHAKAAKVSSVVRAVFTRLGELFSQGHTRHDYFWEYANIVPYNESEQVEISQDEYNKHEENIETILSPLLSSAKEKDYAYQVLAGDIYLLTDKQIQVANKLFHYAGANHLTLYKVNKIAAETILIQTAVGTKAGQAASRIVRERNIAADNL